MDQSSTASQGLARRAIDHAPLVLSGGYLLLSLRLPFGGVADPGVGFFPVISGLVFFLAALVVSAKSLGARGTPSHGSGDESVGGEGDDADEDAHIGPKAWRVPLLATLVVLYIATFELIGHVPAATVSVFGALQLVSSRRVWVKALLAVIVAVGTYLLFAELLGVPLPKTRL
ncbi:tripartite tricarboxylate transporter TctB family protein [Jiangella asiatica]|uniref:tripartite tricarboxylate transporter TctB family protein n=1 Tax=Jiangella asiatica TaxID=2530372 RepID=UPI0013A5D333|nr:tripartite tricarboxylate transporter TctB family protein [Jiangella asiatica]